MSELIEGSIRSLAERELRQRGAPSLVVDEVRQSENEWHVLVRVKKGGLLLGDMQFDNGGKFLEFYPLPA